MLQKQLELQEAEKTCSENNENARNRALSLNASCGTFLWIEKKSPKTLSQLKCNHIPSTLCGRG